MPEHDIDHGLPEDPHTKGPDGYAVTLPDQSAPGGFWFVGAYLNRETADHVARSNRRGAEVRPFRFADPEGE